MIPQRVAERALYAAVAGLDGCHVSTYSRGSHGYAQIGWQVGSGKRQATTAHRAAWVAYTGQQIPAGMTVDHTCKNRRCVNPRHLRLLSNYENARRTAGRDWPLGQCINGHPNELARTDPSGKRICRPCSADWQRAYRARQRAARSAA